MSALYAVLLRLKAVNDSIISPTQGYHAHALFLNLIRQSNSTMSQELHESAAIKPFTISPLQGKFQRAANNIKIIAGFDYWIRLTFLNEELFSHFMDAVLTSSKQALHLESGFFNIDKVTVTPSDSPLCGHNSCEDIYNKASTRQTIELQFLSPTTFRSAGKRNVLFPDPSLVFGSYLSRWQYFSPLKIDQQISKSWSHIVVAKYKLKTHILHFNSYQEVGFEGTVSYELSPRLSDDAVKQLNALADFAFYCGTGAKTTMGMGQTKRI